MKLNKTILLLIYCTAVLFISCKIYSFKDASIPPEVKTIKISYIDNKASYVNPKLSPQLTEKLQQKITNTTRLTRTNSDDAHYQVSGSITRDAITTSGISSQQSATNRLTIDVHITFRNTLINKTEEFDVSRSLDFSSGFSRQQAEAKLSDELIRNLTDEIFNHIFSGW